MEYYEGILFLTTNRLDEFDSAIMNRIHMEIAYKKMDPENREEIWRNLINANSKVMMGGQSWSPGVFSALAQLEINGREIKNLLRTAACCVQADSGKTSTGLEHLLNVMDIKYESKKEDFRKPIVKLMKLLPENSITGKVS